MKVTMTVIGILLIILGLAALGYQGFSYKTEEKIAQFGDVQVTAEKEKRVVFSPILGGAAVIAGIVLVIVGRNGRRSK